MTVKGDNRMKKSLLAALSLVLAGILAFSCFAVSSAGFPTGDAEKHEINFSLNSEDIPAGGGEFNASLFVDSNCGFYSEIVYLVYPDCISVTSAEPVLPSSTFANDSPLYSKKDIICSNVNSKNVTGKLKNAAAASGFTANVGDIELLINSGYSIANVTLLCEQSSDSSGNSHNFMNFKAVDGNLVNFVFNYDPSLKTDNSTTLPIYVICSRSDALYLLDDTGSSFEKFSPFEYSAKAVISLPSLTVESKIVEEGTAKTELSLYLNYPEGVSLVNGTVAIPDALSFSSFDAASFVNYSFADGILSFTADTSSLTEAKILFGKLILDTAAAECGKYEIVLSCEAQTDGIELYADSGILEIRQSCPEGGYHIYRDLRTEVTCTENGYIRHTCIKCGYEFISDVFEAAGHKYAVTSERNPTCTNKGVRIETCEICGDVKTTVIPEIEHDFVYYMTEKGNCSEKVIAWYKCSVCSETKSETLDEYGEHQYEEFLYNAPTCTSNGTRLLKCAVCGNITSETIDKLGHDYQLTSSVDPTPTEPGVNTYTCTRCSDTYEETIDPIGLLGDLDNDGLVSTKDLKLLLKYNLSTISEDDIVISNADIDGDGYIGLKDAKALMKILLF